MATGITLQVLMFQIGVDWTWSQLLDRLLACAPSGTLLLMSHQIATVYIYSIFKLLCCVCLHIQHIQIVYAVYVKLVMESAIQFFHTDRIIEEKIIFIN